MLEKYHFKLMGGEQGDNLYAVVRPESIRIAKPEDGNEAGRNIFKGQIESSMYIGSTMRYTISVNDKTVYVDVADPQYQGMFCDGEQSNLVLKDTIHILRE